MTSFTIGVDIGTTGTKAVLLDVERGIVAQARRESALVSPQPGWAEASTAQWLENTVDAIRELLASSGAPPAAVRAIATTGMVPAVVAVDAEGRALRAAMLQNDARAATQTARLAEAVDAVDVVSATGSAVTQQSVAPKAMWLREHEPDVWAQTAAIIGSYDAVLVALGAPVHVERNWALESGLFAIAGEPFQPVVDAAGLDALLAPVHRPGTPLGGLDPRFAAATGLSPGTALVVGGADHVLSAYAAGVQRTGDWLVKLGGAGDILAASGTPVVDARLYLDEHPIPGLWLPNGCMATSGSLIRWFQHLVGVDALDRLDAEAAERAPADLLCLPYFLGEKSPVHDPGLRGVFAGLHLGHGRADLYRSIIEGIAFGFRHNAEVLRDAGIVLDRATVTNGGSTSMLWKRIHASVLGTELATVRNHPGAALGAAVAAAVGCGALPGWSEVERFVEAGDPVPPDPGDIARYDDAYASWRELADATTSVSHTLSRHQAATTEPW